MRACALVRVATSAGRHRVPVEFNEGHTREQFLRFFVSMFQKYRAHMARPCDMTRNSEPDEIFNREAFIRDQPESARVLVFFFFFARCHFFPGCVADTDPPLLPSCVRASLPLSVQMFLSKFTESQLFYKFLQDRVNRYVRLQEAQYNQGLYDPSGGVGSSSSAASINKKKMLQKHTTELGPNPTAEEYEVVFFEESINAKINRSLFTLSKHDTPFLKDAELRV